MIFITSPFKVNVDFIKYTLHFKFDAGTSRGVLRSKDSYFIRMQSSDYPGVSGYGEAGPLPKLSVDDVDDFEEQLTAVSNEITKASFPSDEDEILDLLKELVPERLPSIRFGMETAILDLFYGGKRKIGNNPFYDRSKPLHINGLIWMGDREFMRKQIGQKLGEGYTCIKMKIGSIDFDEECALLDFVRQRYSKEEVTLRVDANGAFSPADAVEKLRRLAEFDLHSIEQPVAAGQWQLMAELCRESPVPIALDEELIGVHSLESKIELLDVIRPPYIILKPSLVGGISSTKEWIAAAEERGVGWWITSALESNIGLNAIAQLTATYQPKLPQGLGTGQLYHNNIQSPLAVKGGKIFNENSVAWGDLDIHFGDNV